MLSRIYSSASLAATLLLCVATAGVAAIEPNLRLVSRQLPVDAPGVQTLVTPSNVTIRYKEPGVCETTPGVKSFSGYIDLTPDTHMFFWFFEARHNPEEA